MAWIAGTLVAVIVHMLGVAAGVFLVNGEKKKAIALSVVAIGVAWLGIYFAVVVLEMRDNTVRIDIERGVN